MPGLAGHLDAPVDASQRPVLVGSTPITYRVIYRNATRPYGITYSPAATRTLAFDFHHVIPSFRNVTIRHVWFGLESNQTTQILAVDFVHVLQRSKIVANSRSAFSSDGKISSECKGFVYNGSEQQPTLTQIYSTTEFNLGVTAAASVSNPPQDLMWVDLLEKNYSLNAEEKLPFSPASTTARGAFTFIAVSPDDVWGVVIDQIGPLLTYLAVIEFTEE